jgi:hypothetical protein
VSLNLWIHGSALLLERARRLKPEVVAELCELEHLGREHAPSSQQAANTALPAGFEMGTVGECLGDVK